MNLLFYVVDSLLQVNLLSINEVLLCGFLYY